jgi:hypothetical protein
MRHINSWCPSTNIDVVRFLYRNENLHRTTIVTVYVYFTCQYYMYLTNTLIIWYSLLVKFFIACVVCCTYRFFHETITSIDNMQFNRHVDDTLFRICYRFTCACQTTVYGLLLLIWRNSMLMFLARQCWLVMYAYISWMFISRDEHE